MLKGILRSIVTWAELNYELFKLDAYSNGWGGSKTLAKVHLPTRVVVDLAGISMQTWGSQTQRGSWR